jgi:hypothetical protein
MITNKIVKEFGKRLEKTLDKTLKLWGHKNLTEFTKNTTPKQKTQEKTKLLSHFYEKIFKDVCIENGLNVVESSEKGYDIIIDDKKYEMKLTLSQGNNWTGNCYSTVKVNDLILIKLDFDDNNKISSLFFGVLNSINSIWKGSTEGGNSGFSTLSIVKEDLENLDVIYGNIKVNKKNLGIIQESVKF